MLEFGWAGKVWALPGVDAGGWASVGPNGREIGMDEKTTEQNEGKT